MKNVVVDARVSRADATFHRPIMPLGRSRGAHQKSTRIPDGSRGLR